MKFRKFRDSFQNEGKHRKQRTTREQPNFSRFINLHGSKVDIEALCDAEYVL